MLQQCSSSNNSSFSFLFPMSGSMEESANYYSSASAVDCTLSLGTPSTRHTGAAPPMNRSSCGTPTFCWDIITQSSKTQQAAASRVPSASSTGNSSSSSSNLGGDPLLLARRCANCDTTSTPLWRNGPRGPKSLCNACGIRYKKEERRAAASAASPSVNESIGYSNFQRHQQQQQQYPWSCYPSTGTSSKSGSSWCQSDEDIDQTTPYLSWRLNVVPPQFPVTDRTSLFQYQ